MATIRPWGPSWYKPPKPKKPKTAAAPVAPKAVMPTTTAKPAVTTEVPKTPTVTPVPAQTLQSQSDRIGAGGSYGAQLADINRQLRSLSSSYGGAPTITQYSWAAPTNPNYANMSDPANFGQDVSSQVANDQYVNGQAPSGSQMEALLRNLKENQRVADENSVYGNTFFGSYHQDALTRARDEYNAGADEAKRNYDDAVAQLGAALIGAQGDRNTAYRNAWIGDVQNAAAATPQPAQSAAPAPAAPGPPQHGTQAGSDPHVQQVGNQVVYVDNSGNHHEIKVTNSGTYYKNSDGKTWTKFWHG